jgi:lambda family phage portal protein
VNILQRTVLRLQASTASALARAAYVTQSAWMARAARVVTPGRGQRNFAGARVDRLNGDLFSSRTSGSGDLRWSLTRLRARSRTLVRDTAEAKRYCGLMVENVAGPDGILLKPQALLGDGNADTRLNDAVREAWLRWTDAEHCSLDGTLGWVDIQQQLMSWWPMDGEALVRIYEGRSYGPFGLQVQILDPDQLDETLNSEPASGGPWIRQGVELNERGRPIAYHVWDGHPSDTRRGERRRIPADQIVHLFIPWRPGATRGVPWLHAAINNINMLNGYAESALVAARVAASAMGVVSGIAEEDPLNPEGNQAQSDIPMEFEPARFIRAGTGETVTLLDPKHPTTSYSEFHKAQVRGIAQAGGVSYTSLSGDLAEVNYSSIRAGLLSERDLYKILQGRLIRALHTRVYRRWLRMAQLTGALRISAQDVARAERVRFQARGFPWVDPRADIEALESEIALGINSRTNAAAERGRDFEQVLEQIDAEEQLAEQYDVDVAGLGLPRAPIVADPGTTTTPNPAGGRGLRIANG